MALTSWKNFPFFDVTRVKLQEGDDSLLLDQANISCIVAGTDNVFVSSHDGQIHVLQQNFRPARSWKAHDIGHVTHIKEVPDKACLITIAEDLSQEPELKVWSLDQTEKKTGVPKCLCSLTVRNGRKNDPITAFAVASNFADLAVGFGNGAVTVVRGDFVHDRGSEQRTVFESQDESITGLEFREASTTALYIATTSRMLALPISGSKRGAAPRNLDGRGCAVDCMALDPQTNQVVVVRDDAIYSFPRGGKPIAAYEGVKKLARVSKEYILIVAANNTFSRSALPKVFGGAQAQNILNSSSFVILNPRLSLIAHIETLSSQVRALFSIWGDIFLLTVDGKLLRYHEKTFQQKLELLYQRDFYDSFVLAIDMAREYQVGVVQKNMILRKFGDFLYRKGEYDTAMGLYIDAIDNTEPSQVIRKFLDHQRIQNLIDYLEQLHEHNKATSDHTTLLLNCYAKLKDVDKLEAFIRQPGELKFDLDTAIVMCRQAGYYDQAAFLARRHNEHGLVVDILVEDLHKYAESLAYIVRLEPKEAYPNFIKYGTVLLEYCAQDTTQLFIDYFTGVFRPKKDAVIVQETPIIQEGGRIGNMAQTAVQSLVSLIPLPYMNASAAQDPPRATDGTTTTVNQVVETTTDSDFVAYDVPKPREAFSAFIDHPSEFIVFLEACIASSGVASDERPDLYTALFEMYLHQAGGATTEEKTEWERKARGLIESQDAPIDPSNVLLLSDLEKFRAGTILVSEKHGLRFDIFRSYTAAKDTRGALRALHKYGPEEPQLYPAALAYLTSSPETLAQVESKDFDAILQKIDEDGLLAPLQVIQTLSASAVATMGLVKGYLAKTLAREREEIATNRRNIAVYRDRTAKHQSELHALATQPTSFTPTRCAECARPLDLPAVHFLCKHSFHQHCLQGVVDAQDVQEIECPICAPRNAEARELRRYQEVSAQRQDQFRSVLAESKDQFGTISSWFGRGVMDVRLASGGGGAG